MGIFDFFKKKTTDHAGNSLEVLLKKAAADPSVRQGFYKELLNAQLFILTDGKPLPIESNVLK